MDICFYTSFSLYFIVLLNSSLLFGKYLEWNKILKQETRRHEWRVDIYPVSSLLN